MKKIIVLSALIVIGAVGYSQDIKKNFAYTKRMEEKIAQGKPSGMPTGPTDTISQKEIVYDGSISSSLTPYDGPSILIWYDFRNPDSLPKKHRRKIIVKVDHGIVVATYKKRKKIFVIDYRKSSKRFVGKKVTLLYIPEQS